MLCACHVQLRGEGTLFAQYGLPSFCAIIKHGIWGPSCASLVSFVFGVVSSVLYPAAEGFVQLKGKGLVLSKQEA